MAQGKHDSRAVANAILQYADQSGIKLTLMQIIKLVYLVHGWSLTLLGKPFVKHTVQAWQYGPVIPNVYKSFSQFGSQPITALALDHATGLPIEETFDENETELIRSVVDSYGKMHAFQLSDIMHRPGTPWTETFDKFGAYHEIPDHLIKSHFDKLKSERSIEHNERT